jgi:prepilin-type N-terminal cleavage/methylation domain-containing protein
MQDSRGFTLIELLVVIAIIGLLSSVVLASLNSSRVKSRDARRLSDIKSVSTALELYYSENKQYPICPAGNASYCAVGCGTALGSIGTDGFDSHYYPDLGAYLSPSFMKTMPSKQANVCIWYQTRNAGQGFLLAFLAEPGSNLANSSSNQNCYGPGWYCVGTNW